MQLRMATLTKYWPAIVAALYLAYVLAAGDNAQITPAIAALLTALGVTHTSVQANLKATAAHSLLFKPPSVNKFTPSDRFDV